MLRRLVRSVTVLLVALLAVAPVVGPASAGAVTSAAAPAVTGSVAGTAPPAVVGVATGGNHACVVSDDGAVKCWGLNLTGQLGVGDDANRGDDPGEMGDSLPAVDLGAGRTVNHIAAGAGHTCALLDDGDVTCWGNNGSGQLGLGDTASRGDDPGEMGDNLPAVDLGAGRSATGIAAGWDHSCALLDDGEVKCWGSNNSGQLGLGDTASRGDGPGEMGDSLPAVELGAGRTASAIAAWHSGTCALLDDGTVKCWGQNTFGQLGVGDRATRGDQPGEMGDALPSVPLGVGRTATQINVGFGHACARLDDGAVKCWGYNYYGQLGQGDEVTRGNDPGELGDAMAPVSLGTGRSVAQVVTGAFSTCARLDDGTVRCWGIGEWGQLGLGDTQNRGDQPGDMGDALPAVALGAGRTATDLAAHDDFACALLDDGSVKCWGYNGYGQLGSGDTENRGDEPGEMGDDLPVVELADVRAPTVTIRTPADGDVHGRGQTVAADYQCTDAGGSGLASCVGTVPDGDPVDTSTLGDHVFTVTAGDHAGHVTTVSNTYSVAEPRTDSWVKLQGASYKGDDRYNTTAVGQTVRGAAAPGRTVAYVVAVQNDAPFVDALVVRGTASNHHFRVTYTAGPVDVTEQVVQGAYATPALGPGAVQAIRVTVKVRAAAPVGASRAGTVTARSATDETVKDRVGFTTQRR